MARGRDLAGLAALAGLAYMANRKDKETTGPQTTGVDPDAAMGNPTINALNAREFGDPVDQTEAMADMGPRGSRAKVNPETNELYYPEGAPAPARAAPTRSAPTRSAPTRSAAQAPARDPRDLEQNLYVSRGARPAKFRESRYDYSNEGRTYEPKAKVRPKVLSMSDELNPTESTRNPRTGRQYKKGGAVKKMASGGVASASKRADGIASRGKTKCKMY